MRKIIVLLLIIIFISPVLCFPDGRDILKQGLLGAGSGAVGGAVSGGDSGDLWKGALAGAGVNIVGGALLDTMTEQPVAQQPVYVQNQPRVVYVEEPAQARRKIYTTENSDYITGFKDGFDAGYQKAMEGR